jgi:Na+/proline symporter
VLVGLYWRGATAVGAASGIVIGTLAVLGWQVFGAPGTLDPFWIGLPVTLAAIAGGSRWRSR